MAFKTNIQVLTKHRRLSKLYICFFITLIFSGKLISADDPYIGLKLSNHEKYGLRLFARQPAKGLSLLDFSVSVLKKKPKAIKREVKIDSAGKKVVIKEEAFSIPFQIPAIYSLHDYTRYCLDRNISILWQEHKVKTITGEQLQRKKKKGLEIAIPVKIRSKAFQTIFGGDQVSLSVTGQININGGFRHEKRSQVKTAINRRSDYNFRMEQQQQFRVTGNIGEKVSVSVDQDSERPFDFDNTIRLDYKGYDDEIIQSIQAGNISLSLPATRFVSFSGQNSGLFGIKMQAQVGNFHFTTIASQEKGENKTKTITGGAEEGEVKIKDYNYIRGIYFFVDDIYRLNYFPLKNGLHQYDPDRIITNFEIYKSGPGYEQKEGRIYGWALVNPGDGSNPDTSIVDNENAKGYWIRLDQSEYFLENSLGYIRLKNAVNEGEMLAIAYRDSSGKVVGEINFDATTDSVIILKTLKPKTPRPSDKTWDLMFRHVYYLGSRDIDPEGFEVKIFYDTPSGDDQETITVNGKTVTYLHAFGLDSVDQTGNNTPDNIIDNNSNLLRLGRGELEFPSLRPFADPNNPLIPKEKWVSAIYDTTNQSYIASESKFYIQVKSKNRSASYDLGWNVIEGSEEVLLNGTKLVKDKDYIIDYMSGKLTILREEATNPTANVQVNYQQNEMFQLEKKTLLGMRGEYKFWENSFIGGTFLYSNQSTLDQKVRVGKGPTRNMIWDLNTAIKFEPNFLTKAIDAFPFIETKQASKVSFEGEVAQILPNPNTNNGTVEGETGGVAYIDDFEAAKKITPLGVIYNSWRPCSSPLEIQKMQNPQANMQTILKVYQKRGRLIWYNPYEQVAIKEIWPNRDTHNPNTPQRVHVLAMEFQPVPKDSVDDPNYEVTQSWAGVQRWLSSGYADQTDSKFIEIWVQGNKGRLHIDLGQISEDIIPNGRYDSEDIPENGIRNNLLDPGEDVGLDGMPGADPADFWDINGNGIRDKGEPISYDDWYYSTGGYDYSRINGTEGNENDPAGRYPDTEDFNGNGSLDMVNDFFRFSFSLAKDHPDTALIAGGQENEYGWRLYRIPLSEFESIGNPDWSRIEFARIWLDSCQTRTTLRIAEINLVGNDWKEMGVAPDDFSPYNEEDDTTIVAAVANTHENDDYSSPPGVQAVRDRIPRIQAKEQSLVIRINDLPPGSSGILRKTFFQAQNFIYYDKMKMFIHGGDFYGTGFMKDKTKIEIFFRFGSDDNNYYEYRAPVFEGWEGNNMEIVLNDMAQLKLGNPDSTTGLIIKKFDDGKEYRIKGSPSLTNIRQLVLGIKNISNADTTAPNYVITDNSPFTGEVWVNELRLTNVKKDKGMAYRARAQIKVADVFTVNGEINQKDADFHNINDRFGSGNNQRSQNFSGNVALHKFLPQSWGISLPVNFNYSESKSTPKYLPGSDILVTDDTPDSVMEKIRNESKNQGWGMSFKKTTRSKNFLIRNTIDNISISYNQGESHAVSSTYRYQDRKTHTANISYNLNFPKDKYLQPFKWLGKAPIIRKLAELKFFYLPRNFNVKASGNRTVSQALTRTGVATDNRTFYINRSIQTGYSPFKSMSFDFSRNYKNDLSAIPNALDELKSFKFGRLTDLSQSFSAKYNPQISRWLKTTFSYMTNFQFTNNLQLKERGRNARNNTSIQASLTFNLDQMVSSVFKTGKKSSRTGSRARRPSPRRPSSKKTPKKQGQKKQPEKKGSFNPIKMFGKGLQFFTSRIKPINMTFSKRDNVNDYGLSDTIRAMPTTAYMFGFDRDPGTGHVPEIGTNIGSDQLTQSFSIQSGLKILPQMDVSLKFNHDENKNASTTINGGSSDSWFYIEGHPAKGIPIAEWGVRWSGLEKYFFFKKFAQQISFDHNFSGKKQNAWQIQNNIKQDTKESYTKTFRPLIGFNMRLKKNINMNIRYNLSENINFTVRGGSGGQKQVTSDLSISATWSHSGGLRLPLPFLKNKELKNNIDLQITFSMNNNQSFQKLGEKDWTETDMRKSWTFQPQVNYSFSRNVRGGLHFKIGKNSNKRIGDTSLQELGINVSIAIRGS